MSIVNMVADGSSDEAMEDSKVLKFDKWNDTCVVTIREACEHDADVLEGANIYMEATPTWWSQ